MYEFILLQYKLGKINAEQVVLFVNKWITEEEANIIINNFL